METNWKVDIHLVLNGRYEFSDLEKERTAEGVNWNSGESYWFDEVRCEATMPVNASIESFDTGMDAWTDDDADYHSFEMQFTFKYSSCSKSDVKKKVVEDFQLIQFRFSPTNSRVGMSIDYISAWAFFDQKNPLEVDELDAGFENSDGFFPNFLFSDADGAYGDEDFEAIPSEWTFTENLTPKPC